ncbi:MAG: 2-C-methyl-D-erythritol 4-phosphate cytidylyltransferase [Planctomycetota bacterium]
MKLAVIIPAAGESTRYTNAGGLRHKLDEDLGDRPVLHRAVELFTKRDEVASIIVAGPADDFAYDEFTTRHGAKLGFYGVRLCQGGTSFRWETVRNALALIEDDCTHIAIHDAARPCTPIDLIDRVVEAAQTNAAVIPAVDVADTLKRTEDAPDAGDADPLGAILGGGGKANSSIRRVTEDVPRDGLVAVQTPQVFDRELLQRAYAQDRLHSTDDAGLITKLGEPVHVVAGDARNIKITVPADLELARAIMKVGPPKERAAHKRF